MKYFRISQLPDANDFLTSFKSLEENKELYPIINYILDDKSNIKYLKYLPIINQVCNKLLNYCSYKLSREEAKKTMINKDIIIIDEKVLDKFIEIYGKLRHFVEKYEHFVFKDKKGNMLFNNLKKERFLSNFCVDIGDCDYGMVLASIYTKMISWQNQFINLVIHSKNISDKNYSGLFENEIMIQDCSESDIIKLPSIDEIMNDIIIKNSSQKNFGVIIYNYDSIEKELASKYLESCDWDETKAVNKFFSKSKGESPQTYNKINERININNSNNNNIINKEINMNNPNNNIIINNEINFNFPNNTLKEKLIEKNVNNKEIIEVNSNESNDCFSEYILKPILSICCFCCKKNEANNEEENKIFELLPNKVKDISMFKQSLINKLGLIIIYNQRNIPFLKTFINRMIESEMILNSLKSKCIIFPLLGNSEEGLQIQNVISRIQMIHPIFAFCFNPSKNPILLLQRKNIVYKLEGESITLDMFLSTLMDSLEKLNKTITNNITNNISNNVEFEDDFNSLSDAEVLEQQKLDMEALERKVQNKEEELKKQKLLEEQRKKEEEKKKEEEENKLKELLKRVVEEPSEDDPNATIISFRYPDGETRKDRRFLKSHIIQNLYDFVNSLGKEIYSEEENNKFSLYQPFPPKKYEVMENTLEEEGLFPNAIIQIREE